MITVLPINGERREFEDAAAAIEYVAALSGKTPSAVHRSISQQRRDGFYDIRGSAGSVRIVDPGYQIRPRRGWDSAEAPPPPSTEEEKWATLAKRLARRGLLD